ncbi:3-hydroxyacyl-CoA dehydrogenase [Salinibacterium sp. UTAS2018]|uniref:3-hydroxyacyl-CoA dehydrogenase n=1 Tax=Salinibacterium sp. UTAS2018 TaxID=2508880 RepID=UPI0010093D71|nr:3-hydroxyacyl-CoA dehydrogenase [Salinibacterium sp. UTAS2018]QAV70813.1 3-hydroxyacyl-CoA dehydrogenase [Salinibacterium sp. UTAS2018]
MTHHSNPAEVTEDADIHSVAIIGAGSIGIAWSIVFACAGINVRIFELDDARRASALDAAESLLLEMHEAGLFTESTAGILARMSVWEELADAVDGVGYVQECIVEDVEVKRVLFGRLDELTPPHVVLASSTSAIPSSKFASHLEGRARCLVVHPANPPYFLRVAEIVPADFTSSRAVDIAAALLTRVDISPVLLNTEIEGFALNRLQGALLREAYCLVRDGVVSAVDVDTLVREGLGRRWSVIGPFTTSELNTRGGLRKHSEVLGSVYARFGLERGQDNPWTNETIDTVANAIENHLPYPRWEENVRERDHAMIQVASLLRGFDNPLKPRGPV